MMLNTLLVHQKDQSLSKQGLVDIENQRAVSLNEILIAIPGFADVLQLNGQCINRRIGNAQMTERDVLRRVRLNIGRYLKE